MPTSSNDSKLSFDLRYPSGATEIDPNEIDGLIPSYIVNQGELNSLEQENILEAKTWLIKRKPKDILTDTFLKILHEKMFAKVWRWAGRYRLSDKTIGITWSLVPIEVAKLIQDTDYWIKNGSYSWIELAARFHHRLVSIHAFPNGNGRHARVMTDLILETYHQPSLRWGADAISNGVLENSSEVRRVYINALRDADQRRFGPLIKFIQS